MNFDQFWKFARFTNSEMLEIEQFSKFRSLGDLEVLHSVVLYSRRFLRRKVYLAPSLSNGRKECVEAFGDG